MHTVEGIIKIITYQNDENGFAIIKVEVTKESAHPTLFTRDAFLAIKGYMPGILKGENYRFTGDYEHHTTYGEQFKAESYERLSDLSEEGVIDYLSSDLFKGVGEKTAKRIVSTLGVECIDKIIDDSSVLNEVPKLSSKIKKQFIEDLQAHKADEHTLIKLYGYGISPKLANKMIKFYGGKTIQTLEKNPYQLIDDIEGIGFERADIIASKLGFEAEHPERLKAMIVYLFRYIATKDGHTHLPKDSFTEAVHSRLLKTSDTIDEETVKEALAELIKSKRFVLEDEEITLKAVHVAEGEIVAKMKELISDTKSVDQSKVLKYIETFERLEKITYTSKQKQAIIEGLKHHVMILTGGPGTGKTTVIKGLVYVYQHYYNLDKPTYDEPSDIHLIAPTGRAAKRMKEATQCYASTIHKFLGYSFEEGFYHDKMHPVHGELFIVDESSMIDVYLASQLFQSIPSQATVIIVGDDAQLPSVGPGQVLKDLIDSDIIQTITLDAIHRQAEDSNIIALASSVREGQLPRDLTKRKTDRFVFEESPENFSSRLSSIMQYLLKENYDLHEDIQVLIPMYKGIVGIDQTNAFLQKTFNKHEGKSIEHQGRTFKIGDKVLQLVNQAEDGVMNGDQGVVNGIDVDKKKVYVSFMDAEVEYNFTDLTNLTLAYAMSIHKSQGSEYKVVVLPIFNHYHIMLKRKLIYTAITRAKEMVIILGHIKSLYGAVTKLEEPRRTRLKTKLVDSIYDRNTIMEQKILAFEKEISNENKQSMQIVIDDPDIPFETLGEALNGKTPYDFMKEE